MPDKRGTKHWKTVGSVLVFTTCLSTVTPGLLPGVFDNVDSAVERFLSSGAVELGLIATAQAAPAPRPWPTPTPITPHPAPTPAPTPAPDPIGIGTRPKLPPLPF